MLTSQRILDDFDRLVDRFVHVKSLPILILAILLAPHLSGCSRSKHRSHEDVDLSTPIHETSIEFDEVSEDAGVEFDHFDSVRDSLLPEDTGSGLGWADYDNDGDDDLYLVNFAGPFLMDQATIQTRPGNRLFENNGDGKFTEVTENAGVGHVGLDYGCLWFDYDNDGFQDLAVTSYEGIVLYRNRGDRTFEETTMSAGVGKINRFFQGMTAGDYDLDGDLDLYVCGYVEFDRQRARNRPLVAGRPAVWTNPISYSALPNVLFRNRGDGTFEDATESAGVANPKGKSMQALFCDFNNDSWPDLYVGNDVGTADALYQNNRDGTFQDVSVIAGTFDRRASMGLAVGDVWHRGVMDLFTTHWVAEDHALWRNMSDESTDVLLFDDIGPKTGIVAAKASPHVGWGVGLYDFDNDGHLDVMLSNGSTIEDELTLEVLTEPKLIPQNSQVLWNNGHGHFVDISHQAGPFFQQRNVCRGLAFSDYDQDGKIDAAISRHNGSMALLKNITPSSGNWVKIRLRASGDKNNKFGIGARVEVTTGELTQSRQCVASSSYLSTNTLDCHFGLGVSATADQIRVSWPNGTESVRKNVTSNKIVILRDTESATSPKANLTR